VGEIGHRASVEQLTAQPVDLLVIGGGITGAGIARDAAMRGLRTVLVEQHDLASGTSSRSSRLVHGGLRYLEQGDIRLVFEALRERHTLLHIAPHLVRPLPFTFPVHTGDRVPLWKLWAGIWLYDLLANVRNVRWHRLLGKRTLLQAEPMVRERGLTGGVRYFDAQCDDARLTLATARSAIRHGALVANYMSVLDLERADGKVRGARVRDAITGREGTVHASIVVNATGPWSDAIRRMEDAAAPPLLRLTKGSHVLVRRDRLGNSDAITLTSAIDGRVMFVLPWGDFTYIGTTDTDTDQSPDDVFATPEDVVYLLRSANAAFPNARLSEADVLATWAGLRPLIAPGAQVKESQVSREHLIAVGSGGMVTIAGGKLTTYRSMAAQLVDQVTRLLHQLDGRARAPHPPTDTEPLPGGEVLDLEPLGQPGLELGLPVATIDHLLRLYGTECAAIFNLIREQRELATPLAPDHPAVEAEVLHVVRRELALTVEDVLVRRLHLFYESGEHGSPAARRVAELMGGELGWTGEQVVDETERYVNAVKAAGERSG
jgi:glycerol-3-phosphate dehydrogenase